MRKILKKLFDLIVCEIRKIFGYTYKVNLKSKEIHDLSNCNKNCMIDRIKDSKQINSAGLLKYLVEGYNGCRWCMKKNDKG